MVRREAINARMESRKAKTLFEEDYLLGVFDAHRMGALRFKKDANGPFLHDNASLASPPWTSLRNLNLQVCNWKRCIDRRGIIEMAKYSNGPRVHRLAGHDQKQV
ncbi:MAG: hypothetical protein WDO71_05370 [Bacteroidota bacterium]